MTTTIYFLEANVPLTKTFRLDSAGALVKDAYPMVGRFTSHQEEVDNPMELYKAIKAHSDQGHCILKGLLSRPLTDESRKGTTSTDTKTSWICLDFDRHECADIDSELARMGLGDVSYVLQYSASQGLEGTEGTQSAHVFMLLDGELPAPDIKAWLMGLNFKHLNDDLELNRTKTTLRYPLDITTCQNDKLLYIAPPVFGKGLKDPVGKQRITLVAKKIQKLPITRVGGSHIAALKTEERKILNEQRKAEGLPARTAKTAWVGTCEVQNKPDVCTVTGIKDGGEFIRLNLNDGDSWAYWHSKDNFELIHDFKSDTWYRTKELVPGYYQQLVEERQALTATPTEEGDLILAFRDLKTAEYWNGLWNPELNKLELYRAKNETQLDHWMRSHGRILGDFIPIWDRQYDPLGDWVVDAENHRINTFRPSPYFYTEPNPKAKFPAIELVIKNLLGIDQKSNDLYEHFINWLAVVFQRKGNPHVLTSWVSHGTEGTGKGSFFDKVITPLFGPDNVFAARVDNIEEGFNGWMEGKLFIFIDEIDVDDFREKGRVTAKLRNYITEPKIAIRHMRQTAVYMPNYASFMFASNRKQPVAIPEGDRRYNCGNYQGNKLAYPGDEAIESELEAFAAFLLAHKADVSTANRVMQTEARERIQRLGMTSIEETCKFITSGDLDGLWASMPDEKLLNESGIRNQHTDDAQAYITLMKRVAQEALVEPHNCLSRDEILLILQYNVGGMPPKPNKFTSLLRHHGIETKRLRRNGQNTYGIDVDWKVSDELRKELSASKPLLRKIK